MVMVVAATGRDGGGSEGDGGGGLGNDAGGDNNYGGVCEGDGGGGLGEGSVGEGEGGACDGGGCERTIPECPKPAAASTVIFGTSTTSRVDSAPARLFQRLLRARLPLSNGSPAPHSAICQPRAAEEKNECCANEAHVSTRTARWRRPARSSRSRSRRWQASGGEPGDEEGVCPAALRAAGSLQASSKP